MKKNFLLGSTLAILLSTSVLAQSTLNNGLMAHYKFDGNANDASGNGNNGVASSTLKYVADEIGTQNAAAEFNGKDAFINIATPNTLNFKSGESFTLTARVKSSIQSGSTGGFAWTSNMIFQKYGCSQNSSTDLILFGTTTLGSVTVTLRDGVTNDVYSLPGNSTKVNDVYRQITCIKNATDGTLKLYVDGTMINSTTIPATFSSTTSLIAWIGKQEHCDGVTNKLLTNMFKGTMDDFRIYGRALTSTELTQLNDINKVAPNAPSTIAAVAGDASASISFIAPTNNGGSAITGYKVTSNPGNFTATGLSSPITVAGLTNNTSYTFTVQAINAIGTGVASTPSNAVTPKSVVVNDELLAHYKFEGNANDASGNGNNGVASSTLVYVADEKGNPNAAAQFNGIDAFINIPAPNTLNFESGKSFTIVASVKSNVQTGSTGGNPWNTNIIFQKYGCGQNRSDDLVQLGTNMDGYASVVLREIYPTTYSTVGTTLKVNDAYHQITCIKNATDGTLKIYVDGNMIKSTNVPITFASTTSLIAWIGKQEMCDGETNKLLTNMFKGTMDDLKIYARALSETELKNQITSVESEDLTSLVQIGSNPTQSAFSISSRTSAVISVVNSEGVEMDSFVVTDLKSFGENYSKGIYFAKIKVGSTSKVVKIVKF